MTHSRVSKLHIRNELRSKVDQCHIVNSITIYSRIIYSWQIYAYNLVLSQYRFTVNGRRTQSCMRHFREIALFGMEIEIMTPRKHLKLPLYYCQCLAR